MPSAGTSAGACRPSPGRPCRRCPRGSRDGVPGVVLPVEERVLLQPCELVLERRDELRDLAFVLAELEELAHVGELALQPLVALELADEARVLGRDARRARLVVPEPGSAHRLLELDAARR